MTGFRRPRAASIAAMLALAACAPAARAAATAAGCGAAGGDSSQAAMGMCAEAARVAADHRLNAAYGRVLARLGDPEDRRQRDALRDAERAWIGFRDRECAFETAGSYGGSMNAMALAQCATRLSDARTATLAAMAACHDRDGACVLGP